MQTVTFQQFAFFRLRLHSYLAEREGFEPSVQLPAQRFSRPPHSAALASLRETAKISKILFTLPNAPGNDYSKNS
jgi:hypothetical protein